MATPRIYMDSALATGITVKLDKQNQHHLVNVLRMQNGAEVILFNNRGGEYSGELQIERKSASVAVKQFHEMDRESALQLHLLQAISRGDRMDITLQKAVELGVSTITPLYSERSLKLDSNLRNKRMQHWRGVVISACEQSGRCTLPLLHEPMTLQEWLTSNKAGEHPRYILDPMAAKGLKPGKQTDITLLIGPEGGFSDKEIELATEHGCTPAKLGPRILRTETAGIAAITICQAAAGDLLK